jgi:release factor glutamine methyltransferase
MLRQALAGAREILTDARIEEPSLESEILLRHVLNIDRVKLYLEIDRELSNEEQASFWQLVSRRLKGEPTAYITGHREFFGLDFYVNASVLIPRPETELLVEKALSLAREGTVHTIADVGTGCGAIAISLAVNLSSAVIYATDISEAALGVVRSNCRKHGVTDRVILLAGDMLQPLPRPVDLIVANLPYVESGELSVRANFEPQLALDGGPDGLDKVRRLCTQMGNKLNPGGQVLLEIGQGQGPAVTVLLRHLFPASDIEVTPDLADIDRMVRLDLSEKKAISPMVTA